MTFTIYFNKDYIDWAKLLIKSINIIEPEAKIIAHCFNIEFNDTKRLVDFNNTFVIEYDIKDIKHVDISWQIIENKAKCFLKSISFFPDDLHIMIDTDMMLINPLDELKKLMVNNDMGGIRINSEKIAGGFLAVNPTNNSLKLLKEWNRYLLDGIYFFNKDQPSLAIYCKKHIKQGLKWLDVDRQYLDCLEKNDSFIWSAHKSEYGSKKNRFKKYKKKLDDMIISS